MCAPLMAVAALGSSLMGAVGQIQQGNATAAADKYQATAGLEQAQATQTAARANEQQTYMQGDQLMGRAVAAQGANGIVANSGSALQTRLDIQNRTNLNVANQTYNASTATWGALNNASLLKAEGQDAQTASYIGAGSTLLGGASQVASKWGAFSPSGGS